MSNTERIRKEIERRIGAMYNFSSGYSALNTCRELLDFIDGLPKDKETLHNPEICKENGIYFMPIARAVERLIQQTTDYVNKFQGGKCTQRQGARLEALRDCLYIIDDTPIEVQEIRGEVVKDWRGKLFIRASGIRDDLLLGDKVRIYVYKEE